MSDLKLKIYLADDHELVAKGIAQILYELDCVKSVRSFENGKELYKAVLAEVPDVVFLDMEMPEWDGIKTLEELKINYSSLPCIILSMLDEKSVIEESIKKGASGYLHKDCNAEELQEAILAVLNGKIYFSQRAQKSLVGQRKSMASENLKLIGPITERELEVLKLICDGLSSKEIGEKLFVSHRTVETHKNNVMQKFGVNTTGKLISLAIKNKIVR